MIKYHKRTFLFTTHIYCGSFFTTIAELFILSAEHFFGTVFTENTVLQTKLFMFW